MWSVDSGLEQSVTHNQTVLWRNLNSFFDAFMYWPCLTHFFLIEKCLSPATLFKRRLWQWCFPVNFVKFLRTPFFAEHFSTTASGHRQVVPRKFRTLYRTMILKKQKSRFCRYISCKKYCSTYSFLSLHSTKIEACLPSLIFRSAWELHYWLIDTGFSINPRKIISNQAATVKKFT